MNAHPPTQVEPGVEWAIWTEHSVTLAGPRSVLAEEERRQKAEFVR